MTSPMYRVSRPEARPIRADATRSPTITASPSRAAAEAIIWKAARIDGRKASQCGVLESGLVAREQLNAERIFLDAQLLTHGAGSRAQLIDGLDHGEVAGRRVEGAQGVQRRQPGPRRIFGSPAHPDVERDAAGRRLKKPCRNRAFISP